MLDIKSKEKTVTIATLSAKGRGVFQDGKIEVIGTLPGETVLVELGKKRRRTRSGFLRQIITPSLDRVLPRCQHVPECGGCSIQQMDYSAQLTFKEERVKKIFSPFFSEDTKFLPIIGAKDPWQYRNKMEFSFSQNQAGQKFLGLIRAGSKGRVINLKECSLVPDWFIQALKNTFHWWETNALTAYHFRTDQGHLRTLTLRQTKKGKMAILTVSGNSEFALKKNQIQEFIKTIQASAPEEQQLSIFLQIQQIAKGSPTQFFEMLLAGPDHITEELNIDVFGNSCKIQCKISPSSFFQPNTKQAERIYSTALGMLDNPSQKRIYDLYCGGGILGLCAAHIAQEVIGIEINPHAVFDAEWNKEVNHIENLSVYRGDVGEVLKRLQSQNPIQKPDVVIIDPPRTGLSPQALEEIKAIQPQEILYISCNPATQAANIAELIKNGYILHVVQPVDQFPHTIHIENICHLKKR